MDVASWHSPKACSGRRSPRPLPLSLCPSPSQLVCHSIFGLPDAYVVRVEQMKFESSLLCSAGTTQPNLLNAGRSHPCCDPSLCLGSASLTDQKLRSFSGGIHGEASAGAKEDGPAHPRRTGPTHTLTSGEQNHIIRNQIIRKSGASPMGRGQNGRVGVWQWLGLCKQGGGTLF